MEIEKHAVVEGKVGWKGRPALKGKQGGMRAAFLVLAAFGFENMATLALAVNLVTYFFGVMHFALSDAANSLTNFMGVSYILSILAAIFADTWLGRFKTVVISGCLEFIGLALLTVQAHYPSLRPPKCILGLEVCEQVSGGNEAFLFIALYTLAIGSAGIKAALPPHGADQFDEKDKAETVRMSSYFNYLLLGICLGGVVSFTLIVWIQDNKGWDWGFSISTVAIFLGVAVFIAGLPMYRIQVVQGSSVLTEIIQVYVAAIRKRNLTLPEDPSELYEINKDKEANLEIEFVAHRDTYSFLDKAAIIENSPTSDSTSPQTLNPWKLCRVTQVENAKIILAMVPIFCCTIIMTLCLAQLQTFSVQQGTTMDTSVTSNLHIPPASLPIIPILFLVVLVPLYDNLVVPFLRRLTGVPTGLTYLQRIGVGLILSSISMAIAAVVEVKRRHVAETHNMLDPDPTNPKNPPLPITIFWLCFQYFVFGIADMFTYVGLLEFFYSEAPKAIKSISTCFLWSSMAFGYFFSSILVKIVNGVTKGSTASGGWLAGNNLNRNHLDLFYWLLAALSLINFGAYLFVSTRYKYSSVGVTVDDDEDGKDKSVVY